MKTTSRKLILIDGIGALLSTLSLNFGLANFQDIFGVPSLKIHFLAAIALGLTLHSLACAYAIKTNRSIHLKRIAIFNLIYCCFTIISLSTVASITILGLFYFMGEISIILTLSVIEIRTARRKLQ